MQVIKSRIRKDLSKKSMKSKPRKSKSRLLKHIYNTHRWYILRKLYLFMHPICEVCNQALATEVHHIKKFSLGKSKREIIKLAYDYNNLKSTCHSCHQKIHNSLNIN